MKVKYRLISILLLIALVGCIFATVVPNTAEASTATRKLKLGFFAFDGYHIVDSNGNRSGFGYEIMQNLAQYGEWSYDYIGYDNSWAEMQEMLLSGEIDVLTSARKTAAREELFDFCDEPIGYSSTIVTVLNNNITYSDTDYSTWNGIRVGMIDGNTRNDSFATFALENNIVYEQHIFSEISDAELIGKMQDGVVDAIVTSDLRAIHNERIIAKFDSSPFYVIVKKGNTELLNALNDAQTQLFSASVDIRSSLWDKYYSPSLSSSIFFTKEETEYISGLNDTTLYAVMNPDRAPLSYYKNNDPMGILADITRLIASRTGLEIEFLYTPTREAYTKAIVDGTADLIIGAPDDFNYTDNYGYKLTNTVYDATGSCMTKNNLNHAITSIAAIRDTDYDYSLLGASFTGKNIEYYDTTQEVVDAVLSGKQDAAYLFSVVAEKAAQDDQTARLVVTQLFNVYHSLTLGVNESHDVLLLSVLNKAIESISDDTLSVIVSSNTTYVEQRTTLISLFYKNTLLFFGIVALIIAVGIGLVLFFYYVNKQKTSAIAMREEQEKNTVLSDALRYADEAKQARITFLSRVSHEMRTPLNAIIGYINLIDDECPTDVRQDYLKKSDTAAKQLLSIINNVLNTSSLENEHSSIINNSFNLTDTIRRVDYDFGVQAKTKGVKFDLVIDNVIDEHLIGDEQKINHILSSLLSNAIKFTPAGGKVQLKVKQSSKNNDTAFYKFDVSDTGIGMDESFVEKIGTPFEQENTEINRKYGGTGLGVSIVKMLVTILNGALHITSKKGEGSTFTVDVPIKIDKNVTKDKFSGGDVRTMFIARNESLNNYIRLLMENCGIRCEFAGTWSEALATMTANCTTSDPFKLCIFDESVPDITYSDAIDKLRSEIGESIKATLSADIAGTVKEAEALLDGFDYVLTKPYFQSSIIDMFNELFEQVDSDSSVEPDLDSYDFTGKTVMIVEDNALNMEIADILVSKTGATVIHANDGREAVEIFEKSAIGSINLVLMDIHMPIMNGYDATMAIRAMQRIDASSTPIIALSADFYESIYTAQLAGMNEYVAKPIDVAVLYKTLKKWMYLPTLT